MANFATVRNLCIYRGIGFRLFPAPSLAKKFCSSSGPVRFIPGQFSRVKKTRNSASSQGSASREHTSVDVVPTPGNCDTGLSILEGSSLQSSHFYANGLSNPNFIEIRGSARIEEYNEELEELLGPDYESDNELNTMPVVVGDGFKNIREEIEQVAVSLLAARSMTVIELRKKLRGKKYPFHIVESVVDGFKSRGLLNDGMYAESFTRSRWLSSTWGPRRIKHALLQKGVGESETERARKHVFEDDDDGRECDDKNMRHGMCKPSMDRLVLQASKQWLRSQNTCVEKRRARMVRWLQYRGFNWDVVGYIQRKLESQHPAW